LTRAQLELFIQTSIDADGWRRPEGDDTAVIAQRDRARIDAFQIACTMAGKAGTVRVNSAGMWTMCITKSPWRTPAQDDYTERFVEDGVVWCPTTGNSTWFARRNGTVYATGNTVSMNALNFLTFSLRPWLVRLEAVLSNLFPRGTFVRFVTDELLRMDQVTKAQVDQMSLGYNPPPWKSQDEVRRGNDMAPMGGTASDLLPRYGTVTAPIDSDPTDDVQPTDASEADNAAESDQ